MKRYIVALFGLAASLAISPTAFGDIGDFTFNYAGPAGTATGTLIGSEIGSSGSYQITSGTISTDTSSGDYTGVIDSNPADMSAGNADNVLYFNPETASGRYLDGLGLLFSMSSGVNEIWAGDNNGNGPGYSFWYYDDAYITYPGTFNVSAPDGGTTLALLGLAVVGLAGLRRKLSV